MTLPHAPRKLGIIEKLDYADAERSALDHAIFDSYANDGELARFVAQRTENILANAAECFDHLGQDLIEVLLIPYASSVVS